MAEDHRTFPTELELNGHELLGSRLHDLATNGSVPDEQYVSKAGTAEDFALIGDSQTDCKFTSIEQLSDKSSQKI